MRRAAPTARVYTAECHGPECRASNHSRNSEADASRPPLPRMAASKESRAAGLPMRGSSPKSMPAVWNMPSTAAFAALRYCSKWRPV